MTISKPWWVAATAGWLLVALLTVIAPGWRGAPTDRCQLDGGRLQPAVAVSILDAQGGRHQFCSLSCAEAWLNASHVEPARIRVTDEATQRELDAGDAYYVRSRVVAHAPTRETRHVFADVDHAQAHVRAYQGKLLPDGQRPFVQWQTRPRIQEPIE